MTDKIRISRGETINMGDYQSIRVDVSIERKLQDDFVSEADLDAAWKQGCNILSQDVEALLDVERRNAITAFRKR